MFNFEFNGRGLLPLLAVNILSIILCPSCMSIFMVEAGAEREIFTNLPHFPIDESGKVSVSQNGHQK